MNDRWINRLLAIGIVVSVCLTIAFVLGVV